MIAVDCSGCGNSFLVEDEIAGKETVCSACGSSVKVTSKHRTDYYPPASDTNSIVDSIATSYEQESQVLETTGQSSSPISTQANCPYCGEKILATAKKCKHCGEILDVAMRSADQARRISERSGGGGGGGAASSTVVIQQTGGGSSFAGWHSTHMILTLLTCGMWSPIWLIHWLIWLGSQK